MSNYPTPESREVAGDKGNIDNIRAFVQNNQEEINLNPVSKWLFPKIIRSFDAQDYANKNQVITCIRKRSYYFRELIPSINEYLEGGEKLAVIDLGRFPPGIHSLRDIYTDDSNRVSYKVTRPQYDELIQRTLYDRPRMMTKFKVILRNKPYDGEEVSLKRVKELFRDYKELIDGYIMCYYTGGTEARYVVTSPMRADSDGNGGASPVWSPNAGVPQYSPPYPEADYMERVKTILQSKPLMFKQFEDILDNKHIEGEERALKMVKHLFMNHLELVNGYIDCFYRGKTSPRHVLPTPGGYSDYDPRRDDSPHVDSFRNSPRENPIMDRFLRGFEEGSDEESVRCRDCHQSVHRQDVEFHETMCTGPEVMEWDESGIDTTTRVPCRKCGNTFEEPDLPKHDRRCPEEMPGDERLCANCGKRIPEGLLAWHESFCKSPSKIATEMDESGFLSS